MLSFSLKNLKEANHHQIAGGTKKLAGLHVPTSVADGVAQQCGENICKVFKIVMKGHVYFSKEYTRMVKRTSCVVLLSNGKVVSMYMGQGIRRCFFVYEELEPDLEKPFFYENAGCHVLRMKPERYFMDNNQLLLLLLFQTVLRKLINLLKIRPFHLVVMSAFIEKQLFTGRTY